MSFATSLENEPNVQPKHKEVEFASLQSELYMKSLETEKLKNEIKALIDLYSKNKTELHETRRLSGDIKH